MEKNVKLIGTSTYLPGEPIKFEEINNYLGNFDKAPKKIQDWVDRIQPIMKEMLGLEYCHYAFNNKTRTFDEDFLSLAVKASKLALEDAAIQAKDINLIIYGGAYSHQVPPITTRIQEELGIDICGEFHIHSNCSSVYKSIKLAHTLLKTGEYKNALVVSSHVASSCFIPEFYNQEKATKEDIFLRWYLCDGAGAFILTADDEKKNGFYLEDTYIESSGGKKLSCMGNDYPYHWSNPLTDYANGAHHTRQLYLNKMAEYAMEENGKSIFYNALLRMLEVKKINLDSLKYFVVNMPSKGVRQTIMEECAELNVQLDQFYHSIEKIGYTGPPAALISIDLLLKEKQNTFKNGDLVFSFVMEVSKFMQAGFTLRYVD
ncbi:3-oxoacyl-ACP synthase III family protein [Clostridium sp. DJ247]|uniref:3-oxoacyl-ACP synthase III family protein n=1 Tax=Clostridium sp. DJ247 TaxID=2726188 RepID=UPI001623817C|nr:3-oxoacyl-ACP synthase III family protein [Clostridium sp. DJ247]MBC2581426.1 3-oxoacyl-ACP synthase III family protein [Clostridium sp. DJ247]